MHVVKDENGKPVEHGHHHEEHHDHDHHDHGHEVPETKDQMAALLDYMLHHNEHHAAELDQMADKLRASGNEKAADQIKTAVEEFQKGNMYLSLALSTVKES